MNAIKARTPQWRIQRLMLQEYASLLDSATLLGQGKHCHRCTVYKHILENVRVRVEELKAHLARMPRPIEPTAVRIRRKPRNKAP